MTVAEIAFLFVIGLLIGHIVGYKTRKREEDVKPVEIILNEDGKIVAVKVGHQLATNVETIQLGMNPNNKEE